ALAVLGVLGLERPHAALDLPLGAGQVFDLLADEREEGLDLDGIDPVPLPGELSILNLEGRDLGHGTSLTNAVASRLRVAMGVLIKLPAPGGELQRAEANSSPTRLDEPGGAQEETG